MTYSGDGQYLAVVGVDTNIYIVSFAHCVLLSLILLDLPAYFSSCTARSTPSINSNFFVCFLCFFLPLSLFVSV